MIDYNDYHILTDYKGWYPKDSASDGEGYIRRSIDSMGYNSIWQQAIEIPTEINPRGFAFLDIFVPELELVIEYNGGQHYDPNNIKQQKRDTFVRNFCKVHGLYLVELDSKDCTNPNKNKNNLPLQEYLHIVTMQIMVKAQLRMYAKNRT